jgi:hypothetical protein
MSQPFDTGRSPTAFGGEDHTALPSALASLVLRYPHVHRIPRPTFMTIAKRPS